MDFLTDGILSLTWQQLVMYAVGITLIWLAIKKGMSRHFFCLWDLAQFL